MITIGIDGNEANVKEKVGVHQVAYEMLRNIHKLRKEWEGKLNFVIYLKENPRKELPEETDDWKYKVMPSRDMWISTRLTPHLIFTKNKPDVFYSPTHYLPPAPLIPKVMTIHDLGYLKFSGQFRKYDYWQLKWWTAISISISKRIISVSQATKQDIVRHYPKASKKVDVAYNAYDKRRFNTSVSENDVRRIKNKFNINGDYVLFLSTLKPSKNIEGLLDAWSMVNSQWSNVKLVIAGKKGWLYNSIFEKVKELELEDNVIFTDFVFENDKPALLTGARVFASPSFWEGFGIHVLEAMACGTPPVVSRVASLPEVAGKAAVYVDESNPKSIATGIEKVLKMPAREYNKLVEKSVRQARKFSWEKSAKKVLKVFEQATE